MQHIYLATVGLRDRLRWLSTFLSISLPLIGAVSLALIEGFENRRDWLFLTAGVMALGLHSTSAAMSGWTQKYDRQTELAEANRLRVAMKDALQPLTEILAAMPYERRKTREIRLQEVARQAVGSLVLLLKDVDRVRAVVYAMAADQGSLKAMAYHGRSSKPSPFVKGTARGDRAIKLVEDQRSVFVVDLDREKPEDWEGSGSDYRTLIAAAISNGQFAYGMVAVDAPIAGSLRETDLHIVMLVADLLAIGFAEADRP